MSWPSAFSVSGSRLVLLSLNPALALEETLVALNMATFSRVPPSLCWWGHTGCERLIITCFLHTHDGRKHSSTPISFFVNSKELKKAFLYVKSEERFKLMKLTICLESNVLPVFCYVHLIVCPAEVTLMRT